MVRVMLALPAGPLMRSVLVALPILPVAACWTRRAAAPAIVPALSALSPLAHHTSRVGMRARKNCSQSRIG